MTQRLEPVCLNRTSMNLMSSVSINQDVLDRVYAALPDWDEGGFDYDTLHGDIADGKPISGPRMRRAVKILMLTGRAEMIANSGVRGRNLFRKTQPKEAAA